MELSEIQRKIYEIRDYKVMLDRDLAELYGVTTFNLNKAVKRNTDRFPEDFMFQLNSEEFNLIFQNGISSWGGTRKLPYAFTEHGVAMLAGLLNSAKAIEVNRRKAPQTHRVQDFVFVRLAFKAAICDLEQ